MTLEWNAEGTLPSMWFGGTGQEPKRSPYKITIGELVQKFAFSKERKRILKGLLDFRRDLYCRGITQGFQWIDGSFIENIEMLENRSPNDVDIVTFFMPPADKSASELEDDLVLTFSRKLMKTKYMVDSFFFQLGMSMEPRHVGQIVYWHSMWSHRRDGGEKGFFQVELSPDEDKIAQTILGEADNGS